MGMVGISHLFCIAEERGLQEPKYRIIGDITKPRVSSAATMAGAYYPRDFETRACEIDTRKQRRRKKLGNPRTRLKNDRLTQGFSECAMRDFSDLAAQGPVVSDAQLFARQPERQKTGADQPLYYKGNGFTTVRPGFGGVRRSRILRLRRPRCRFRVLGARATLRAAHAPPSDGDGRPPSHITAHPGAEIRLSRVIVTAQTSDVGIRRLQPTL